MFNNVYAALNSVMTEAFWSDVMDNIGDKLDEEAGFTPEEVTEALKSIVSSSLERKAKAEAEKQGKKAERAEIAERILEVLKTCKSTTASDIAKGLGYTTQKISYILREMVADGLATADRTSRVIYYSAVE